MKELCVGVTAGKDKIYIGGNNKVIILNTEGSFVREITTPSGFNNNLLYNESTIFHLHMFYNPCIYIPSHEMTHYYKVVICCQK
jgi:hypothetical protein